jgi:hypothetical protein
MQTSSQDNLISSSHTSFFTFKVSVDSSVYVCIDTKAPKLPSWMITLGFKSVGERIKTKSRSYQLYEKLYVQHTWVKLGGSCLSSSGMYFGSKDSTSMYAVFIVRSQAPFIEPCVSRLESQGSFEFNEVPQFGIGNSVFADDSSVTAIELPLSFKGKSLLLIQTYQADKAAAGSTKLILNQLSEVYLCVDERIKLIPTWVHTLGLTRTKEYIACTECRFVLYFKSFGQGLLNLGSMGFSNNVFHTFFAVIVKHTPCSSIDTIVDSPPAESIASGPSVGEFWDNGYGHINPCVPDLDKCFRRWSAAFNLTENNKGEIFASGCLLSVRVQSLVGVFYRSRVVTLLPRFVLVNRLDFPVIIAPFSGSITSGFEVSAVSPSYHQSVGSNESCVLYHFPSSESVYTAPYVRLTSLYKGTDRGNNQICINMIGEQFLWLKSPNSRMIVSAVVMSQGTVFSVTLSEASNSYPFKFENRSHAPIKLRQYGSGSEWIDIKANSWKAFCWPKPFIKSKCLEVCIAGFEHKCTLLRVDKVGKVVELSWSAEDFLGNNDRYSRSWREQAPSNGRLGIDVIIEFTTKIIKVYELSEVSTHRLLAENKLVERFTEVRKKSKIPAFLNMENISVYFHFSGVYFRVSDNVSDIMCLCIEKISLKLDGERRLVDFQVFHVQIDDLSPKAKFPVVFAPSNSGRNSHLQRSNHQMQHFFKVSCNWKSSSTTLVHLKYLDICIKEMSLKLSFDLLMRLISVIGKAAVLWVTISTKASTVSVKNIRRPHLHYEEFSSSQASQYLGSEFSDSPSNASIRNSEIAATRALLEQTITSRILKTSSRLSDLYFYLETFHYNILIIHTEIFVGNSLAHLNFQLMDKSIATGFAVLGGPMLSFITSVVGSIAHASPVFVFNEFLVLNFFGDAFKFGHMIYTAFNQEALSQAYKLFGSLELIGNPLSFIDNISTGVTDFYSHTIGEVGGSSNTRGEGVRRLAYSVIIGTFGAASRVSGSLADLSRVISGKGEAADTGQPAPETLVEGLQQGGGVLLRSMQRGITGLVNEPRRGLQREGIYGVIKGLGKGVIRLFAKPLTGTLDAVSLLTESIENGTQIINGKPVGKILKARRPVERINSPIKRASV